MPTFTTEFTVRIVTAVTRVDASITVVNNPDSGTALYRADATGQFRIPFTYTVGKPRATKAFRIEWEFGDGTTSGPITDLAKTPVGSFHPAYPLQVWDHDRDPTTRSVPTPPREVFNGFFLGVLPTIEGKYDATITLEQP